MPNFDPRIKKGYKLESATTDFNPFLNSIAKVKSRTAKNEIHRIHSMFEPQIIKAFINAALKVRDSLNLKQIETMLVNGESHKVAQLVAHKTLGKALADQGFEDVLLAAYREGGEMGKKQLPNGGKIPAKLLKKSFEIVIRKIGKKSVTKRVGFLKWFHFDYITKAPAPTNIISSLNLTNPATLEYLNDYLPTLVEQLDQSQMEAVTQAIQNGFSQGNPIPEIAKDIRNSVGLTSTQQSYVDNFRTQLETGDLNGQTAPWDRRLSGPAQQQAQSEFDSEDTDTDAIDGLVDTYQTSLINRRAQNIAITEVHNASIIGQRDIWNQAEDIGLIDDSTTLRHWIFTHDDRVRDSHANIDELNPDGVGLDEPFDTDIGPVTDPGQSGDPSFDINCRCVVALSFTDLTGGTDQGQPTDDNSGDQTDETDQTE